MNWFKHDADATTDAKLKKLIIRYGAIGYAVYFHCLELIVSDISESNITFELEHDSEIIADDLRIKGDSSKSGIEIVEEIMKYMIELHLFEESNGHIFCFKLLKRLDSSMTSNVKLRAIISEAKENHDAIMTCHDDVMQDKIRIDKIRKDKIRKDNINISACADEKTPILNKSCNTSKIQNNKTKSKAELFDYIKEYTSNETLQKLLSKYLQYLLTQSKINLEQWKLQLERLLLYSGGNDQIALDKVSSVYAAGYRQLVYDNELKIKKPLSQKSNWDEELNEQWG